MNEGSEDFVRESLASLALSKKASADSLFCLSITRAYFLLTADWVYVTLFCVCDFARDM